MNFHMLIDEKKNKVGLLTIHWAHNYGAFLQAYATQKIIEKLGCVCEIVNYQSEKQESTYRLFQFKLTLSALLGNIRNFLCLKRVMKRRTIFEQAIRDKLNLSPRRYTTASELKGETFDYDLLLAGSDQIWNLQINAFDPVYFLPFGDGIRKASYAASLGDSCFEWNDTDKTSLKSGMSALDEIAVRESSGAQLIHELTGRIPYVVLDPTLLLGAADWDKLSDTGSNNQGDYILFYSVLSDPKVVAYVTQLSRLLGIKVICPHPKNRFEVSAPFVRMSEAGPGEFINLIRYARVVCTTSFHATVFSILYKKPFYSMTYGHGGRIAGLLSSLCLSSQIIDLKSECIPYTIPCINYDRAFRELETLRHASHDYLKRILSDG